MFLSCGDGDVLDILGEHGGERKPRECDGVAACSEEEGMGDDAHGQDLHGHNPSPMLKKAHTSWCQ